MTSNGSLCSLVLGSVIAAVFACDGQTADGPDDATGGTSADTVVNTGGATQQASQTTPSNGATSSTSIAPQGGATSGQSIPATNGGKTGGTSVPQNGGSTANTSALPSGGGSGNTSALPTGGSSGKTGVTPKGGATTTQPNSGGSAGAGSACCLAMPVCGMGETQVKSVDACPPNMDCYSVAMCCSTIWCARPMAACDAIPTCSAGDKEITGTACPEGESCYSRTLCGTTITCLRVGCNPDSEFNRNYIGTSTSACAAMKFTCVANTTPFFNDCGCGCEQDANCPEYVDCMPSIVAKPQSNLCTDDTICPLTVRAM